MHCGFCLPACPTYVNLHDENDSPRGRLVLMRRLLDGELPLNDPDVGTHFDRCLGCRACETACPSGVPYGALLEATRATLRPVRPVPVVARIVLGLFLRPRLMRAALAAARLLRATPLPRWLARALPSRLAFPFAMLAATRPARVQFPARPRSAGQRDGVQRDGVRRDGLQSEHAAPAQPVAMLRGCVMRGLFAHTNAATSRVLQASGYAVTDAPAQGCCGALHEAARALARINIAAFEQAADAPIAVNSAGCGAMMKEYGHLLADDPAWSARAAATSARVRDISELVVCAPVPVLETLAATSNAPSEQSVEDERAPAPVRIAYDPPCHLSHAQRITVPPLTLLDAVVRAHPSATLVPLADAEQCCGSAGIYNLIEPETSDAVLAPKLGHIADTRAHWVATGNPGCLMQIGAGLLQSGSETRVVHPVELLDAALRAR